jgi:hypothetical protein
VKQVEFRQRDLLNSKTEKASSAYRMLLDWTNSGDWDQYLKLLQLEDDLALDCKLRPGEIVIDVPRTPHYADLENLELPGRGVESKLVAGEALMYKDWIDAYKVHRAYIRIYAPRHCDSDAVFAKSKRVFDGLGMELQESNRTKK